MNSEIVHFLDFEDDGRTVGRVGNMKSENMKKGAGISKTSNPEKASVNNKLLGTN